MTLLSVVVKKVLVIQTFKLAVVAKFENQNGLYFQKPTEQPTPFDEAKVMLRTGFS